MLARETADVTRRLVAPKCDEGESGCDFLSTPDTRLKPGADENRSAAIRHL